ncbi:hypothetical protein AB6A40_003957 [Gnathostoma spinigerum]|uniref:Uncharacterized protein n=1 Tax=Gnathostoma spinigerum TaxID=75299 RepID=A0ABD6EJV0_9BILA
MNQLIKTTTSGLHNGYSNIKSSYLSREAENTNVSLKHLRIATLKYGLFDILLRGPPTWNGFYLRSEYGSQWLPRRTFAFALPNVDYFHCKPRRVNGTSSRRCNI